MKALIFDDQNRLLVFRDSDGTYEMPGGGLEHGESLEQGITRELYEEMRITPASIGKVQCVYSGAHDHGYHKLCIAVPVTIQPGDFIPSDDDIVAAEYVTSEQFKSLPFGFNEKAVLQQADAIWAAKVEKTTSSL